jgi:hypothetical protein
VFALILLLTGPVSDFARLLVVATLVVLGVVWIELTRSQTLHEFPATGGPALLDETMARISTWREGRRAPAEAAAPAGDVSARLSALADLHARGELTDEEYASAKARVLASE